MRVVAGKKQKPSGSKSLGNNLWNLLQLQMKVEIIRCKKKQIRGWCNLIKIKEMLQRSNLFGKLLQLKFYSGKSWNIKFENQNTKGLKVSFPIVAISN